MKNKEFSTVNTGTMGDLARLLQVSATAISKAIKSERLRRSISPNPAGRGYIIDLELAQLEWVENNGRPDLSPQDHRSISVPLAKRPLEQRLKSAGLPKLPPQPPAPQPAPAAKPERAPVPPPKPEPEPYEFAAIVYEPDAVPEPEPEPEPAPPDIEEPTSAEHDPAPEQETWPVMPQNVPRGTLPPQSEAGSRDPDRDWPVDAEGNQVPRSIESRAVIDHYKAETAKLEYLAAMNRLVSVEEVGLTVGREYANVRAALLAIPAKIAEELVGLETATEARIVVEAAITEALGELSYATS